ncbi:hypothetical protein D3C87_770200 [compost metagenome]
MDQYKIFTSVNIPQPMMPNETVTLVQTQDYNAIVSVTLHNPTNRYANFTLKLTNFVSPLPAEIFIAKSKIIDPFSDITINDIFIEQGNYLEFTYEPTGFVDRWFYPTSVLVQGRLLNVPETPAV